MRISVERKDRLEEKDREREPQMSSVQMCSRPFFPPSRTNNKEGLSRDGVGGLRYLSGWPCVGWGLAGPRVVIAGLTHPHPFPPQHPPHPDHPPPPTHLPNPQSQPPLCHAPATRSAVRLDLFLAMSKGLAPNVQDHRAPSTPCAACDTCWGPSGVVIPPDHILAQCTGGGWGRQIERKREGEQRKGEKEREREIGKGERMNEEKLMIMTELEGKTGEKDGID